MPCSCAELQWADSAALIATRKEEIGPLGLGHQQRPTQRPEKKPTRPKKKKTEKKKKKKQSKKETKKKNNKNKQNLSP